MFTFFVIVTFVSFIFMIICLLFAALSFSKSDERLGSLMAGWSALIIVVSIIGMCVTYTPPIESQVTTTITGKNTYFTGKVHEYEIFAGSSTYYVSFDQYNSLKAGDSITITLSDNSVDSIVRN